MNPPKGIIDQLHQLFAKFFWRNKGGIKGKHWIKWKGMCYPKQDGGLGFRCLHDVNNALFAKLWWTFRTSTFSLWSVYIYFKYYKKYHPVLVYTSATSNVWRKMLSVRESTEHLIGWQMKVASSLTIGLDRGLIFFKRENAIEEEIKVRKFIHNYQWNILKLKKKVSEEMVEHVLDSIKPECQGITDKAVWVANSSGDFTVKSAFHLIRRRRDQVDWSKYVWCRGLLGKISFFLWRVIKIRLPTDDVLQSMRVHLVSKCYCCDVGERETITHLLLTALIAQGL